MKKVFIVLLTLLFLLFPITSIALTGGPDSAGYIFVDSTGASDFVWDNVSSYEGIGIPKEDWPDLQEISIGFDFTFYGKTYDKVYISPYGYLTFDDYINCYSSDPRPIPTAGPDFRVNPHDNFIAGVWGYLLPST